MEDVAGVRLAQRAGFARIELCSALAEAGLTASIGTISQVLAEATTVDVQVLIRPRPGHFRFNDDEIAVMERDIAAVRAIDPDAAVVVGFTLGALQDNGGLDQDALRRLIDACGSAPTTLHRCVDRSVDIERSVADAARLGFTRVLTSGGAATATEGAAVLERLVHLAGNDITILAAGGVRAANVRTLVARAGVREVHLSARCVQPEAAPAPRPASLLGDPTPLDAAPRPDADVVRDLLAELGRAAVEEA